MAAGPIIVLGAGGHAKVVIDLLRKLGHVVVAAVEAKVTVGGRRVLGVPVEDESIVFANSNDAVELALGLGMPANDPVAGLTVRRHLGERFRSKGFRFPPLIHPSAAIGEGCRFGDGAQVMAGAVVQAGTEIGLFAIVNTRASVDHDCVLDDGSHVAPGATLGGNVRVGEDSLVGISSAVRPGISIGKRALIGGGTMVTGDIPDGGRRVGVLRDVSP
jgi:UDP-perosamine 4-acetyltransferase